MRLLALALAAISVTVSPRPAGLWVAADGGIYATERDVHRVRRIDPATGEVTTVVGRPSSTAAASFGSAPGDGGPC